MFNEAYYLRDYSDVNSAVTSGALDSGFEHFLLSGLLEGRSPTPWFSAADYRAANADVSSAITSGLVRSAYDQFVTRGITEDRALRACLTRHIIWRTIRMWRRR